MNQNGLIIIADYSQGTVLTLEELCDICHLSPALIRDYIAYDIIHPQGESSDVWVFDLSQAQRLKTALRLQHDLELNMAGVAMVLDLLDEMENLRSKMELIQRHYLR